MIPATLIYNAGAGGSRGATPESLVTGLGDAGYDVTHLPTQSEDDLAALANVSGAVFVAGGDGTVRGVAKWLVGRQDVCLGIIPLGTSNNIGHTLKLPESPDALVRAYRQTIRRPFDVGRIAAPWGKDLSFEACGCGIFAELLAAYDPEEAKSPLRAAQAIVTTLPGFRPQSLALSLDGQPLPEQSLALLEVMNICATGNSMRLATSADPSDGLLNVVQVSGEQRDSVLAYAAALTRNDFEALPSVEAPEAKQVQIPYFGQAFHVDGEVRPAQEGVTGTVEIQVWPGALPLLVPAAL